ncbi:unnamed protein product [Cuscuta europaea]|uniref:Uncharacterized protein n=1 Tax=Cuscuta europaea TaxID=41803 RepID=A0A9P0ZUD4_CUSEU|nr:unnamed protein product [Cuscuta europaea]
MIAHLNRPVMRLLAAAVLKPARHRRSQVCSPPPSPSLFVAAVPKLARRRRPQTCSPPPSHHTTTSSLLPLTRVPSHPPLEIRLCGLLLFNEIRVCEHMDPLPHHRRRPSSTFACRTAADHHRPTT